MDNINIKISESYMRHESINKQQELEKRLDTKLTIGFGIVPPWLKA